MARIVVTHADDDDEVIIAGGEQTVEAAGAAESTGATGAEGAAEAVEADEAASGPVGADERCSAPSPSDAYRATSLDDLKSSPMPLAQRVVIVAAVVCIIGALVYYFVAMR